MFFCGWLPHGISKAEKKVRMVFFLATFPSLKGNLLVGATFMLLFFDKDK